MVHFVWLLFPRGTNKVSVLYPVINFHEPSGHSTIFDISLNQIWLRSATNSKVLYEKLWQGKESKGTEGGKDTGNENLMNKKGKIPSLIFINLTNLKMSVQNKILRKRLCFFKIPQSTKKCSWFVNLLLTDKSHTIFRSNKTLQVSREKCFSFCWRFVLQISYIQKYWKYYLELVFQVASHVLEE